MKRTQNNNACLEFVESKVCTKCQTAQPLSNYWRSARASDGLNSWCKGCVISGMRDGCRKRKKDVIEMMGGVCAHCNNVYHPAAFDFHHLDPSKKEGGIAQMLQSYAADHPKIKQELEKCILLCSNCHRILHAL